MGLAGGRGVALGLQLVHRLLDHLGMVHQISLHLLSEGPVGPGLLAAAGGGQGGQGGSGQKGRKRKTAHGHPRIAIKPAAAYLSDLEPSVNETIQRGKPGLLRHVRPSAG